MTAPHDPRPPYERSGVSLVAVAGFGWLLLLTGMLAFVLLWQLDGYFARRHQRAQAIPSPLFILRDPFPPEPRLQGLPGHEVQPLDEMRQFRAQEDALLGSYGWVDRQAGIVRIPIAEAMRKLAAHPDTADTTGSAP